MKREPRITSATSFERLRAYLENRATFTADEIDFLRTQFVPRSVRKGEFLQRVGEPARYAAFVSEGCLRSYIIDARGKEHIIHFAPEEWWLADSSSLMTGSPATFFIDAIESSELLLIDAASHQRIVDRVPGYAAAFRVGLIRHAAAREKRIIDSLSTTAEQRYLDFVDSYPSILRRVPQRMLASYLGMSPETLSRIRKTLSKKKPARRSS